MDTPEYAAFRLLFANLAGGVVDPLKLAVELFSEGLVDKDDIEKAGFETHTKYKRMTHLLKTVLERIVANPETYEKLREVLDREPSYGHLANLMTKTLGEGCFCTIMVMGEGHKAVSIDDVIATPPGPTTLTERGW